MTSDLAFKHCVPCEGGVDPMSPGTAAEYLQDVPGWHLVGTDPTMLHREWKFRNFVESISFVNRVADIAEEESHHPDIHISWNRVTLELFTHVISGLSENDFIIAAKINELKGGP
jgi:4a-hydroxytetrahydrobiopterin dehydratase